MSEQPFKFREAQREILTYRRGLMGVSAVPGAGKTFTLSHLAAALVQELTTRSFKHEREVLVVTFTNSAVNSFKSRIASILQHERGLLPYTGYRVRTLHGLAHDIVRERPALVGLSEDFRIVDERVSLSIKNDVVSAQLPRWGRQLELYIDADLEDKTLNRVLNRDLPQLMEGIAGQVISRAKANRVSPADLQASVHAAGEDFVLLQFAAAVYADYQRSLSYRGAVDFDDLVRLAINAIESDAKLLTRLQKKWPYILEDEAQDSSRLQEDMLSLLSAGKNWVRVGDPNQAINTTFTTADARFLRAFLDRDDVRNQPLQTSGRSARKIIHVANQLVQWASTAHPIPDLHRAFYPQDIMPTLPGDVQQNPPDEEANIYIHPDNRSLSPDEELDLVVRNLKRWIETEPGQTVAVLVPENSRGYKVAERLRALGIAFEELLRSSSETRQTATVLQVVLNYLADPARSQKLAYVYNIVWLPLLSTTFAQVEEDESGIPTDIAKAIIRLTTLEDVIAPTAADWLNVLNLDELPPHWVNDLEQFLELVRRWLDAIDLPIDQLLLTVGGDLFHTPVDIALTYKIAAVLKGIARENPMFRLTEFVDELRRISENERRFIGFDDAEQGYEPRPDVVTISTMHAAKGLEWDRVYLMSVNNYSFPSALPSDDYISEKWFVRNQLNLEAETLAQLEAVLHNDPRAYREGNPTLSSRIDNAAERLRLLYVAITRARRELVITWNTGRFWERGGNHVKRPALPLIYLMEVQNAESG
jgi:DNA helicase II / ATP-dependent DNA helicase PcrA